MYQSLRVRNYSKNQTLVKIKKFDTFYCIKLMHSYVRVDSIVSMLALLL